MTSHICSSSEVTTDMIRNKFFTQCGKFMNNLNPKCVEELSIERLKSE